MKKKVTITISHDWHMKVKAYAMAHGLTMGEVIEMAIRKSIGKFKHNEVLKTNTQKIEYKEMCWDCGKDRYKEKRDMGAIGIALRKCPECKKKKGVIPARDWAYRAGEFEKVI